MPIDLTAIGTAAAIGGTQLAIDTASGAVKSRRGYKYSNKLADEQQKRNIEMTDYNLEKQKELWEATSYPAQKAQLEKAGMNPAYMYGMQGGGGQTAAVATANGSAPGMADVSSDSQGVAGMALQRGMELQLMKAQKENIEADTEAKKADAGLKGEQQWLTSLNRAWEQWMQTYNPDTGKSEIGGENSMKQKMALQDLTAKEVTNELTKQNVKVSEQEVKKMIADVIQRAEEIALEGRAVSVSELLAEFNTNWGNIVGREALETLKGVIQVLPFAKMLKGGGKIIQGFGGNRKGY